MKKTILSIAAMSAFAISATAGELAGYVPSDDAAMPAVSAVTDWSGFYGGLTGSFVTRGVNQYYYSGVIGDSHDLTGAQYGGFAGYNLQRNNFVYGAEAALLFGDVYQITRPAFFSDMSMDIKARVGYVAGSALIYGFAGGSMVTWDNNSSAGLTNRAATGFNYGAGIDLAVSDRLFVGVEYIMRDSATEFNENPASVHLATSAVQVRIGSKF